MKKLMGFLGCVTALVAACPTVAQERIYRCGNEYTNNASVAKERNCKVVDGGQLTVVHTQRPAATGAAATSAGASAPPARAPVDPQQQKARDSDARVILQSELNKAQERLRALQEEFNGGNPTKSALELRNPQVYGERLDSLRSSIARQERDIAGIERELARLPGG